MKTWLLIFFSILVIVYVYLAGSAWISYGESRNITPANISDSAWKNGISLDGTIILINYTKRKEQQISDATEITCSGKTRKISEVWYPGNGWIYIKIMGNPMPYWAGYPNICIFEK